MPDSETMHVRARQECPEAVVMPAPGLVKLTCHKGATLVGLVVCIERVDAVVKRCYVHHVVKFPNAHVGKVKRLTTM